MKFIANNLYKLFRHIHNQPKVSILIPVYNAEGRLNTCLDSAISQTLSEIEIICIDDKSTDNSLSILNAYTELDKRISIIRHSSNKGEGYARNSGISAARGEFIFHLDSDDTLPFNALEKLYIVAKNHNSDLVKGRFDIIYSNGSIKKDKWSTPNDAVINTNIFQSNFLQRIPTSHVSYLYNRKLIVRNNLYYNTDLKIGLDIVTLTKILTKASNVSLIPDVVYHYHQTDTSVTRGSISLKIAKDSVQSKALTAKILDECGLHEAAISRLKAWEYIIDAFWAKMTTNLDTNECILIFNKFRKLIMKYDIQEPWTSKTSDTHKQILMQIISKQDREAIFSLKGLL